MDCCTKCLDLKATKTKSLYIKEKRTPDKRRFGDKYTNEEIKLIIETILKVFEDKNVDDIVYTINKNDNKIFEEKPNSIKELDSNLSICFLELCYNLGRSRTGFLSKLYYLGFLSVPVSYAKTRINFNVYKLSVRYFKKHSKRILNDLGVIFIKV